MRALGPESVSSFLKIAVDVVYAAACIAAAVVGPLCLFMLVWLPFAPPVPQISLGGHVWVAPLPTLALVAVLLVIEGYVGCLVVILNRIRRIMETLVRGDPFHPANVARLRWVGAAMIGLEAAAWGLRALLEAVGPRGVASRAGDGWFNPTAWFAVLVVFVLAEVFREGARLRRDSELTI
jgi:hypothetical protein